MALAEVIEEQWQGDGNKTWYKGYWTFDSSYPTGGEPRPTTAGVADNRFARLVMAGGGTTASGLGYMFLLDNTAQNVVVVWGNAGSASVLPEVTNATDLSALTKVPFLAISD